MKEQTIGSVVYRAPDAGEDKSIIAYLPNAKPLTNIKDIEPDMHVFFLGELKQIIKAKVTEFTRGAFFASNKESIWLLDFGLDHRNCWLALGVNMSIFQKEDDPRIKIQQTCFELTKAYKEKSWFSMCLAGTSTSNETKILLCVSRELTTEEKKEVPLEHNGISIKLIIVDRKESTIH